MDLNGLIDVIQDDIVKHVESTGEFDRNKIYDFSLAAIQRHFPTIADTQELAKPFNAHSQQVLAVEGDLATQQATLARSVANVAGIAVIKKLREMKSEES